MKTKGIKSIFILSILFSYAFGQGNLPLEMPGFEWKTNGNIVSDGHYFGTKNEMPIKFRTNDVERFRITPEGNIGIGTSTPEAKLDVFGNVIFRNGFVLKGLEQNTSAIFNHLIIVDETGNIAKRPMQEFDSYIERETDCYSFPKWKNGPNRIFTSCPETYVGINQITPRVHLDVRGTIYSYKLNLGEFKELIQTDPYFYLNLPNAQSNQNLVKVFGSQGSVFEVNNNGLITAKRQSFHNQATDNFEVFGINNPEGLKFAVYNNGAAYAKKLYIESNLTSLTESDVLFKVSNLSDIIFQVNNTGLVQARKIMVNRATWSDYVFEKDYVLPSLTEIERYILQHKHLPDIPSEKEVIENGIDLGEMNNLLLKKIEEMTLYLIQQQKQIDELKKEISNLK